jgi:hypothetical protein
MDYRVKTFRDAGLEAKWGKTSPYGGPVIYARCPNAKAKHQREQWWMVDHAMWRRASVVGIRQAFEEHTLLGDIFSIAV